MLRPGHDTSCPYKNRCEFFNFTELCLDAIALNGSERVLLRCAKSRYTFTVKTSNVKRHTGEISLGYSRYPSNVYSRNNMRKFVVFGLVMFGMGVVVGGVAGVFLFIRVTGGTAAPSVPISAPTLLVEINSTPTVVTDTSGTGSPIEATTLITDGVTQVAPASTRAVSSLSMVVTTPSALTPQLFRIVSEESEVRFSVDETVPFQTAVGRTNQVAGDIIFDFNTPSNSRLGVIRINLRTLQTDSVDRDRSIRCCVLLSAQDAYEFSDFTPTVISGLPEQVQIGQTAMFQVTGDLTLRGTTRAVTFNVSLTAVSTSELRGLGRTVVNRSDFGILNDAENMFDYHGVAEAVTLEFEFVARAVPQ